MGTTGKVTAGGIAKLVGGRLIGPADTAIAGVAALEGAGPGDLSFIASPRYLTYLERTNAGAVLITAELAGVAAGPATRIVVPDPHQAVARVLRVLYPVGAVPWGVHHTATVGRGSRWEGRIAIGPHAVVGQRVKLGADCVIGAGAVLEDGATLGSNCRIGPRAVISGAARLGNRVAIQAGASVGTPGFAYTHDAEAGHVHVPHIGRCLIEDDVEIGANSTVDRGSIGDTVIGSGTKVDNLVHIAHNVRIGRRCLIMAQVGIAGSTIVEDGVMLAGQAGLADHLTVGRDARIGAQAGVIGDIPAGSTVSGYPARPHREVLRQAATLRRLAKITQSLERLAENRT